MTVEELQTPRAASKRSGGANAEMPNGRASPPSTGPAPCIVCGSDLSTTLFPGKIPWLRKCQRCGLVRTYPVPSEAELAAIYDSEYFRTFGYDPARASGFRRTRALTFDRFLGIAERHVPRGRLLDVGSGLGDLLATAAARGWNARGVEPNGWAAAQADRVAPGVTEVSDIADFEPAVDGFDLITCVDVLEHLAEPDEVLPRFFSWLRPGGAILLVTPDIGSIAARALGPNWPHFHVDHLWYFDRESLIALVRAAGFEVAACMRAPKVFNIAYIAGIMEHNATNAWIKAAAGLCLRACPRALAWSPLPALGEGLLLIATRLR